MERHLVSIVGPAINRSWEQLGYDVRTLATVAVTPLRAHVVSYFV